MTNKEQAAIQQLAQDALDLIRAARSITRELADQNARQIPATADLLQRNLQVHTRAAAKSAELEEAIKAAKGTPLEISAQSLVQKTAVAREKANQLSAAMQATPPNPGNAAAALQTAFDADEQAADLMLDFRSRIEKSEETPAKQAALADYLSSIKQNAGSIISVVGTLILGLVAVALVLLIIWVLKGGGSFLSQISQIETARGVITFLVCVATVGIALMLVVGGLLLDGESKEDREKRFSQGKDVLTVLVGILGTILGFYFASDQTARNATTTAAAATAAVTMNVATPTIARVPGVDIVSVSTTITGGKAPYIYSIVLADKTTPMQNETNQDGRILTFLTSPAPGKATLSVHDSSTNQPQEKNFEIGK